MPGKYSRRPLGMRIIKTARSLAKINAAAQKGLFPLVKPVIPNPEIRSKFAVFQNLETGEISVSGDYRNFGLLTGNVKMILDWTFYYPYTFPSPFAAYLIPPDLKKGERVWLEDLIEDIVGESWEQGDNFRLKSAEAIWNGEDLNIQFRPEDRQSIMG